jgi:cell wall assembly regulator SMI1
MRRVATSWKVIEGVLRVFAPSVCKALRPSASVEEIDQLQDLIGVKLPRGLVTSLRIHDGMRGRVNLIGYRSLLPVERIRSWWRLGCQSQRQDGFGGNDYTKTPRIKNDIRWRERWVPVMETVTGDLQVLDLDPAPAGKRGQLFPWYINGATAMRVVADSFPAWLDAVAEELAARRFTLDDLGTIQLEKRLV